MNESEKYRQFRNMMFNEIGITKHDIRAWVREAVQEQVEQMIAQSHDRFAPEASVQRAAEKSVRQYVGSYTMSKIIREETGRIIGEQIANKFTISVKEEK